jgi:hypothetical protein
LPFEKATPMIESLNDSLRISGMQEHTPGQTAPPQRVTVGYEHFRECSLIYVCVRLYESIAVFNLASADLNAIMLDLILLNTAWYSSLHSRNLVMIASMHTRTYSISFSVK